MSNISSKTWLSIVAVSLIILGLTGLPSNSLSTFDARQAYINAQLELLENKPVPLLAKKRWNMPIPPTKRNHRGVSGNSRQGIFDLCRPACSIVWLSCNSDSDLQKEHSLAIMNAAFCQLKLKSKICKSLNLKSGFFKVSTLEKIASMSQSADGCTTVHELSHAKTNTCKMPSCKDESQAFEFGANCDAQARRKVCELNPKSSACMDLIVDECKQIKMNVINFCQISADGKSCSTCTGCIEPAQYAEKSCLAESGYTLVPATGRPSAFCSYCELNVKESDRGEDYTKLCTSSSSSSSGANTRPLLDTDQVTAIATATRTATNTPTPTPTPSPSPSVTPTPTTPNTPTTAPTSATTPAPVNTLTSTTPAPSPSPSPTPEETPTADPAGCFTAHLATDEEVENKIKQEIAEDLENHTGLVPNESEMNDAYYEFLSTESGQAEVRAMLQPVLPGVEKAGTYRIEYVDGYYTNKWDKLGAMFQIYWKGFNYAAQAIDVCPVGNWFEEVPGAKGWWGSKEYLPSFKAGCDKTKVDIWAKGETPEVSAVIVDWDPPFGGPGIDIKVCRLVDVPFTP